MISIDVNALNDLAEVEKAIEKLSFVRDALKKTEDAQGRAFREVWDKTFGPTKGVIKVRDLYRRDDFAEYASKIIAENTRGIGLTPHHARMIAHLNEGGCGDNPHSEEHAYKYKAVSFHEPFMDPQEAIQGDGIVCLIDGKKRKFLSRYVQQVHGMEWQDYLDRYDLPADYPQTCKDLIEQRRKAAIDRGFGKHDRDQEAEQQQVQVTVPIRKTFGRRGTSQQVSVQVDISRSVNTTADRRKERKLEGLL